MKRDLGYVWHLHFVIAGRINLEHQWRWVFFKTLARRRLDYRSGVDWLYAHPKRVNLGSDR